MCTQYVNINKGCCIPPDTYIGIFSVPDHPGYLVRWTTPPWYHSLSFDDLHLSGSYVFYSPKGDYSVFPNLIFENKSTSYL